jgi:sialate O-acetylesterase
MKQKLAFLVLSFLPLLSLAHIRLPALVGSNMVLQQNAKVKIWGWASPAEKIVITPSWSNHPDTVVATRDANWMLTLQTPAAGGPYTITLKGNNTIVLDNVMIGEVWVCSGQSNMEWSYYNGLKEIRDELPTAANPNIRFFQIPKTTSLYPQDDIAAQWTVCDSNTLKGFSAVGYFFGKNLNKELHVPIGLINSSWGGTPAEVWLPEGAVDNNPALREGAAQLKPAAWWPHLPGRSYNAMIAPLTNFTIAGAIWYQGESNTGYPGTYSQLLTTLIDSWRRAWEKNFPFYYVQIAPYKYGVPYQGSLLREQQTKVLDYPNTGMVVITDLVNDTNNIHPTDKHDVGLRLANYALGQTYGRKGFVYKSPRYKGMITSKGKAIVQFDNAPEGLVIKDKVLREIYIAGADKVFYPAQASIEDNKLVVWSKDVKEPVAVRYGFSNTAMGNLFNKAGLPADPFRTDDWEL